MTGKPQRVADAPANCPIPADAPPDIAGMVGQYAHGNEPSHHIAYLYVYAGQPWKTQSRVRSLMETMYSPTPEGIAGNEDVGQMSAWFILSALGFYSVDAVSGNYILGSPLFDKATVDLGNGKQLQIDVQRSDPAHAYIESFSLNGKKQKRAYSNSRWDRNHIRISHPISTWHHLRSRSELHPSISVRICLVQRKQLELADACFPGAA